MAMKIFHTADLHIGMKFARGYSPEVQEGLIEARFETLQKMIEAANTQGCDIFVIAGDLFDSQRIPRKDILSAAAILKNFDGACVLILPGNHDYMQKGEGDLWASFRSAMPDRTLLLESPHCLDLRRFDINGAIYPAPCTAKHSRTNAIGWIRDCPKDPTIKHHLGIAHGSLEGVSPDLEGDYYPMLQEELRNSGVDLWLMGHSHIRYPDQEKGTEGRIFFPSTPEPDGFDCNHPGYAWLIALDDDKAVHYESIRTGKFRFLTLEKELSGEDDMEGLKADFGKLDRERRLVKLKLKGRVKGEIYEGRSLLIEELNRCVLHLEYDLSELLREITIEDIDREFTEGSFPHRLLRTLARDRKSPTSLQIAYDLIREAGE
jgi:DNA repair exonuclease SbcCD nuclease subunit